MTKCVIDYSLKQPNDYHNFIVPSIPNTSSIPNSHTSYTIIPFPVNKPV